jgi:hypothetical protein
MDWRFGSSGREPALQEQSPKFKTPVPPKTKKKCRYSELIITARKNLLRNILQNYL